MHIANFINPHICYSLISATTNRALPVQRCVPAHWIWRAHHFKCRQTFCELTMIKFEQKHPKCQLKYLFHCSISPVKYSCRNWNMELMRWTYKNHFEVGKRNGRGFVPFISVILKLNYSHSFWQRQEFKCLFSFLANEGYFIWLCYNERNSIYFLQFPPVYSPSDTKQFN